MEKIIIFGSTGQLGSELLRLYPNALGVKHGSNKKDGMSLEDEEKIASFLRKERPDVIINAAAVTNVDRCEREKEYVYKVNGLAVRNIARIANEIGTRLVHISTDYIFDGATGFYLEDSVPNPINYYGLSKLAGDLFAQSNKRNLIIRTSGVYGYSNNFPIFAYYKLKRGETVLAMESYYSPIHVRNLAVVISKLMNMMTEGVVNVAGERVSRVEFARRVAEKFGFDLSLVVKSDLIPLLKAKRPFDTSLNTQLAKDLVRFDFYSIKSNLEAFEKSISMRVYNFHDANL